MTLAGFRPDGVVLAVSSSLQLEHAVSRWTPYACGDEKPAEQTVSSHSTCSIWQEHESRKSPNIRGGGGGGENMNLNVNYVHNTFHRTGRWEVMVKGTTAVLNH